MIVQIDFAHAGNSPSRYTYGGRTFNSPYEACAYAANKLDYFLYTVDFKGKYVCNGYPYSGPDTVRPFATITGICSNGKQPNSQDICEDDPEEKCPDGSIKQPGKECPKKCPSQDSIGPQYPYETPVGYRCEGGCIVEVSRAVFDSGCWKSIKRPF